MSNKLYEESSIQSIAAAIRTKNDTDSTYKVADMANAIQSFPNYFKWSGTVSDTILGLTAYITLVSGSTILKNHRTDESLAVCVRFSPTTVEGNTVLLNRGYNKYPIEVTTTTGYYQYLMRYNASADLSAGYGEDPLYETEGSTRVGRIIITEQGDLRVYSMSINYAIRPGAWSVEVTW